MFGIAPLTGAVSLELPYTSRKFDDCLYIAYIWSIYTLYLHMSKAMNFYAHRQWPSHDKDEPEAL
jgi:hypothetical protein